MVCFLTVKRLRKVFYPQQKAHTHYGYTMSSKTSIRSQASDEGSACQRPKSSTGSLVPKPKKYLRTRSRTMDESDLVQAEAMKGMGMRKLIRQPTDGKITTKVEALHQPLEPGIRLGVKGSDCSVLSTDSKSGRPRQRSEIPKLKSLARVSSLKPGMAQKKLPLKVTIATPKEPEVKVSEVKKQLPEKWEPVKMYPSETRKHHRFNDQIDAIMNEEISNPIPRYRKELKKITDAWVNTIYCSLTMRTNLIKLLFLVHPQVSRNQFQMEDDTLLKCIIDAKKNTRSEAENLVRFIKSVLVGHQKAKEQYASLLNNNEIAQIHNNNWNKLNEKIAEVQERKKVLESVLSETQRQKDSEEKQYHEKIRCMEVTLEAKGDELKKLLNQLNVNKNKESHYRRISTLFNTYLKENINKAETEMTTIQKIGKDYEELRESLIRDNEVTEKEIKELEVVLGEKTRMLEKETQTKKQLQALLDQIQAQKFGNHKEQIEYILRNRGNLEKRREELWSASVKLVLRGFLIQMKRLERDRNRMLLELRSSDLNSFNALASTIFKRDNFMQTIKTQMTEFQNKIVEKTSEKNL